MKPGKHVIVTKQEYESFRRLHGMDKKVEAYRTEKTIAARRQYLIEKIIKKIKHEREEDLPF